MTLEEICQYENRSYDMRTNKDILGFWHVK